MAGGDVDRAQRAEMDDLKRDGGGRRRSLAEMHRDAVAGDDLGGRQGKVTAGEALVVADDHAARQLSRLEGVAQILGKPLGAAAQVVEGIVLTDLAAPAVSAENDVCHGFVSVVIGNR